MAVIGQGRAKELDEMLLASSIYDIIEKFSWQFETSTEVKSISDCVMIERSDKHKRVRIPVGFHGTDICKESARRMKELATGYSFKVRQSRTDTIVAASCGPPDRRFSVGASVPKLLGSYVEFAVAIEIGGTALPVDIARLCGSDSVMLRNLDNQELTKAVGIFGTLTSVGRSFLSKS